MTFGVTLSAVTGRVLLCALALAVASAHPAPAHRSDPTIVARIDAVEPPIDGVVVQVRAGVADQILLVNTTGTPVEVVGVDGKPFLRIAKDSVEADVGSRDWRTSLSPLGVAPGAPREPQWRVVASLGSWGWFDHRMHHIDRELTPALRQVTAPVRLADWTVPLRHGGRTHVVKGHVEYRPVVGAFRSRVTKTPDGLDVDVLDGRVPGLFVRWQGSGTLLVKGIEGEPFARFTPSSVEVNERSVTWRDDRGLQGRPFEVGPGTDPVWTRQGAEPRLTWLDRRLAYAPGVPPDDVARRTKPTTMVEWDLPVEIDGRPAAVSGETTWHPSGAGDAGNGAPARLAAVAGAAAALAVVLAVARGRRRRRVEP